VRSFDRNVTGIGVLADAVGHRLYRFVCSQDQTVSRDQAAQAVGIARHRAKFHLDGLEAEGLLEADYVRLTGRSGPGAGRPTKRYRRGTKEFAVRDSTVILPNCPFQALAAAHTDPICRLNHSLRAGFADSLAPDLLEARLERGENRCCVIVASRTDDQQSR
jgi:predicted ArsR family transcriptional regulator